MQARRGKPFCGCYLDTHDSYTIAVLDVSMYKCAQCSQILTSLVDIYDGHLPDSLCREVKTKYSAMLFRHVFHYCCAVNSSVLVGSIVRQVFTATNSKPIQQTCESSAAYQRILHDRKALQDYLLLYSLVSVHIQSVNQLT